MLRAALTRGASCGPTEGWVEALRRIRFLHSRLPPTPKTAGTRRECGRAVRNFKGLGAEVFDGQEKMAKWVIERIGPCQ